jgi:hypothetical protein
LSFLRSEAQETVVTQIRMAMITFALFMVREIYCKLNSILGDSLRIKRISDAFYSQNLKNIDLNEDDRLLIKAVYQEQQTCRQKAKNKLPSWIQHQCLFAAVPLEQCTSEKLALAKSQLFGGDRLLSLTGGLGVDDWAFSNSFGHITSLDTDKALNTLVRFNQACMGMDHIERLDANAEEYLQQQQHQWDCIYIDPDRRPGGNRITGNAAAYSPDVISLYQKHGPKAKRWLIKLSPMTDISWFERQMQCHVKTLVFSYKGEVKELLVEAGNHTHSETVIVEVNEQTFNLYNQQTDLEIEASPKTIFCELSAAAIKAGFRPYIIEQSGLTPINKNSFYLTGNAIIPHALGRCFVLEHTFSGSLGEIEKQIQHLSINKANISARDFVLSAEETRKKLRLEDGGDVYLFFTGKEKTKYCFVAKKPD